MAKPVLAKSAIQSDEEAGREAQDYQNFKAEIEQIDAEERAAIAAIKQEFDERRRAVAAMRDERFERVHAWAEATRGGRKTIKFPNGREARWRFPSRPKLVVAPGKLKSVVRSLLKRENWEHFLDITLRSDNIKANPEVMKSTRWLNLEKNEYFTIG